MWVFWALKLCLVRAQNQICWVGWTEIRSSANTSPLLGRPFFPLSAWFWWFVVSTSPMQSPPSALLGDTLFSDPYVAWVGVWCWEPNTLPGSSSISSAPRAPFFLVKVPHLLPPSLPSRAPVQGTGTSYQFPSCCWPQVLQQNTPCPCHQLQTNNKPDPLPSGCWSQGF